MQASIFRPACFQKRPRDFNDGCWKTSLGTSRTFQWWLFCLRKMLRAKIFSLQKVQLLETNRIRRNIYYKYFQRCFFFLQTPKPLLKIFETIWPFRDGFYPPFLKLLYVVVFDLIVRLCFLSSKSHYCHLTKKPAQIVFTVFLWL